MCNFLEGALTGRRHAIPHLLLPFYILTPNVVTGTSAASLNYEVLWRITTMLES